MRKGEWGGDGKGRERRVGRERGESEDGSKGGGDKVGVEKRKQMLPYPHHNCPLLPFLPHGKSPSAVVVSPLPCAVVHILRVEVPALAEGNGVVGRLQLHGFQDPHHHTQLAIPLLSETENNRYGSGQSMHFAYPNIFHI